jgi:hypothetical protein
MVPQSPRLLVESSTPAVDETVIRTFVHKRRAENVLLTGFRRDGPEQFLCTGRMPASHPFFTDGGRSPRRDILFYSELGRQASIAVSHAFLGADEDDVFIFENSEASITEAVWRAGDEGAHEQLSVAVQLKETARRKNGAVTRAVAEYSVWCGADLVFSATGTWTVQSAALFRRLRRLGAAPGARAEAESAAGDVPAADNATPASAVNVVISPPLFTPHDASTSTSLLVDRTHSYFFDHPCDHVPGMLLLEACAQLVLAAMAETAPSLPDARRPAIAAYGVTFAQFVECDLPTTLTARPSAGDGTAAEAPAFDIVISQRGAVAGTAHFRVALPL